MRITVRGKVWGFILLAAALSGCEFLGGRYQNKEHGFSLYLPDSWIRQEGFQNTAVLSRPVEKQPKYQTNVTVTVGDLGQEQSRLPRRVSLLEFFEANKQQVLAVLPGNKYDIKEGWITAGKEKGLTLSFNYDVQGLSLSFLVAAWMKDYKVYTITCSTEKEKLPHYLPIFNKIFRSLKIE